MVDLASHRLHATSPPSATPRVRPIDTQRPWAWLAAGWRDMCAAPLISAFYGALAVGSSFVLVAGLAMLHMHYLVLPMAAGFMLVGPVLAVGLYESSRLLERGERVTPSAVLGAYHRNGTQIATMGVVLMLALLAWIRVALLVFAIFFSAEPPALDQLVTRIFFSSQTIPFLLTGTAVGAVIATAVFAISAVSLPMLLDRETDVFTAMATSVDAVRQNGRAMLVWAALIALFTAAGIATAFVGLAIAFPLIGHATWHCYRDLVAER
ncbi:DUF2189 domain-containing protein [Azospirillum sp. TSO22-1]|uniref:DUF2189 domain-containing protein n=1 Tax=Azospirillum sp. TSO22-1 TaxID=716789 RepID=UPI000D60D4EE|nr:DUF2189 domain-containing protein [Azospirillum sp. TSO22-1]PWC45719.1 hypothetical protein TSO221_16265 [Azospirillum sp. TSO22-1]